LQVQAIEKTIRHLFTDLVTKYVIGFVKRGLPHTSNLPTLMIQNFRMLKAIDQKFGQKEAPKWQEKVSA